MARKFRIAVGLLFLAIFLTSVLAVPLAVAQSSPPKQLRCRVVKRTPRYLFVKHSHPRLHLKLHKARHYTKIRGHRYKIVKRSLDFIVLRAKARKPRKPPTPPVPPTPTPTPTPTPSPTVTPTPSSTPTVTPTPTPPPPVGSAGLILQPADLAAIRAKIADGIQPWTDAWSNFTGRVSAYLDDAPNLPASSPLSGPVVLDTVLRPYMDQFSIDGAKVRNLGIAYGVSQSESYLAKARELLLAWARGYTPTSYQDCPMPDTGQTQAYGAFCMAYGYDFIKSALTASERQEVQSWFARLADAEQTALEHEHDRLATTSIRREYEWSMGGVTNYYNPQDRLIGGDFAMLISGAVLACSYQSEQRSDLIRAIYDQSNTFSVSEMVRRSTAPTNDGDYVPEHGVPVPMMMVFTTNVSGRGGMLDYGTYNVRLATVLLEMGPGMRTVAPAADVVADHPSLAASWDYMARFFGPGSQPDPNPTDVINLSACLPRFMLALRDVPSDRVRNAALSGSMSGYYESQWLGPVTLTHSPLQ